MGTARASASPDPVQRVLPLRRFAVAGLVLVVVAVIAASLGSVHIPPFTVARILIDGLPGIELEQTWPDSWETILWQLRLPRVTLGAIVGCALALAGATYQGMFRNPLADPYLIGAGSGAGLGAIIVLVAGVPSEFGGVSLLPVFAFMGAIAAVVVAYTVAQRSGGMSLTTLILAGVAVAALANAVSTVLMMRSDTELQPVLAWLLGGLISAQWKHGLMMLPYLLPSLVVIFAYSRVLNVLQLDESQAHQMGVNIERTKTLLIAAATLATAAAVAFSGIIGFVGIIAPHSVRLIWGFDHRALLPMTAVTGAGFLILADLAARTVISPTELPVGIVTAFCGAPFFLYLLRLRKRVYM